MILSPPPQLSGDEPVGVWVGLAPFYLDVDEMGVLTGRAWLILAWKDHREEREIQFDMICKRE